MKPEPEGLSGLQRVARITGAISLKDRHGNETRLVWDYANECAVPENQMLPGSDAWQKSERAKYEQLSE